MRQEVIKIMPGGLGPEDTDPVIAQQRSTTGSDWRAPIWDRPSEGTVPAVLAVDALMFQNDVVAVAIDRLEVYPNGFMINLFCGWIRARCVT